MLEQIHVNLSFLACDSFVALVKSHAYQITSGLDTPSYVFEWISRRIPVQLYMPTAINKYHLIQPRLPVIHLQLLSWFLYDIYIYIYLHIYISTYMCIYIYIYVCVTCSIPSPHMDINATSHCQSVEVHTWCELLWKPTICDDFRDTAECMPPPHPQ